MRNRRAQTLVSASLTLPARPLESMSHVAEKLGRRNDADITLKVVGYCLIVGASLFSQVAAA